MSSYKIGFFKKMTLAFLACDYLAFCPHMGSHELSRARMRPRETFLRKLMKETGKTKNR